MSGTVTRKLYGTLALGVALAIAGAGCLGAPGESADDDEDVAAAVQELDSVLGEGSGAGDGEGEEVAGDGDDQGTAVEADEEPGEDAEGPEPLPWRALLAPSEDPTTVSNPAPMSHGGTGAPSGGTGGK